MKIKNRGTQRATGVEVRGYHAKPGAGLSWPADFDPLTTAQSPSPPSDANNSEEKTVGPFDWTPNINAYGHDCLLMVVAADGGRRRIPTISPPASRSPNGGWSPTTTISGSATSTRWRAAAAARASPPVSTGSAAGSATQSEARDDEVDVAVADVLRERGWSVELDGIERDRGSIWRRARSAKSSSGSGPAGTSRRPISPRCATATFRSRSAPTTM